MRCFGKRAPLSNESGESRDGDVDLRITTAASLPTHVPFHLSAPGKRLIQQGTPASILESHVAEGDLVRAATSAGDVRPGGPSGGFIFG